MTTLTADRPLFHRVSWGALFAGFFIGFGIWMLLLALGAGIGLAAFDPKDIGNWQGLGIGFGIWGVIAGIIAMFIAGFFAARLSASDDRTEGMLHGIALWGFMLVAGIWIATMAVGKTVSGAASVAGGAAQVAGQAAAGAASDAQARQNAQRQAQQLQTQAQQKAQQAQQQIQQNAPQAAEKVATAGTTGAWAFFIYGVLTLAAAAFGGRAGAPRTRRILGQGETAPLPDRPLSPQHV